VPRRPPCLCAPNYDVAAGMSCPSGRPAGEYAERRCFVANVGLDHLLLALTVDREVRGRRPRCEGLDEAPKLRGIPGRCGRDGTEPPAASVG
jgi:hypothetical protein